MIDIKDKRKEKNIDSLGQSGFGWRYEGEFDSETSFEVTDSLNKELIMILNHLQSSETNFFV